jgi:hypothetical protein
MPFHIADLALPPRAAIHEAVSQDDPYHADHRLQGDIVLRKLDQDKRFISLHKLKISRMFILTQCVLIAQYGTAL